MWQVAKAVPVAIALVLGVAACQRGDPLDGTVRAPTPRALTAWRAQVTTDTSVETRRRVEEAFQEIRLRVSGNREIKRHMGEPVAVGPDVIDEGVCQKVDGKRLREVVQLGYEFRVERLKMELAALEDAMKQNAQLVTKPGDLESRHHLDALRERQTVRVEKYRTDLAAAGAEVATLLKTTGRRMVEPATDKPDQMPERVAAPKK
jgi:hypothetical protein